MKPHVFERGDKIFLVNPLAPIELDEGGLEEKAFAAQIKKLAPNENLLWLQGRYVEAERANLNGQQWREGDIVIKSLQPMFMPVTEMHDYRTAVGLIADTKLLTPEAAGVPRARIDTTLAIWAHRFEKIAEEIQANYEAGTLMQSMEATAPWYECSECGQLFHKLPGGAERAQWCDHLLGNGSVEAARILGGVTFTGTGLIFGSRGSEGAYTDAHLDVFEDAVAEYHEKAHRDSGKKKQPRRHTSMDTIEIPRTEHAELLQRPTKDTLEQAEAKAREAEGKLQEAESKLEAAETEVTKKDGELQEANQKLETAEEESRKAELRDERLGKLGSDFTSKLGDTAKRRLREQAGEMSDDDWSARLEELSELVEVKPEEGEKPKPGEEFSEREVASTAVGSGGGGGGGSKPSEPARKSTVAKLMG
jgi:hypothetical protein